MTRSNRRFWDQMRKVAVPIMKWYLEDRLIVRNAAPPDMESDITLLEDDTSAEKHTFL